MLLSEESVKRRSLIKTSHDVLSLIILTFQMGSERDLMLRRLTDSREVINEPFGAPGNDTNL